MTPDLVGCFACRDHCAQLRRDLEKLDQRQTARVTREATFCTTGSLDVSRRSEQSLLCGSDHRVQLVDGSLEATVRTDFAHQTLCRDTDQTGGDAERLDTNIGETGNRSDRIVGVKRRQNEVTGHRRLKRDRRRLLVADFSYEQNVGVLTQH